MNEAPRVDTLEESEEVRAKLREALSARLANTLQWEIVPAQPLEPQPQEASRDPNSVARRENGEANGDNGEETDEEEPPEVFEFRMFGSSKPAAKVELEHDRPFKPGQGTILARRPTSYYFARPSPRLQREYASALVTWEQVMERSRQRLWGLERPWKTIATITTTTSSGTSGNGGQGDSKVVAEGQDEEKRGRKRLGKKTRIVRRKRMRALEAKKAAEEKKREAEVKKQAEKEEHLKDKKKRLNHVKKLRARAKAKAMKAAARAGGDGGQGGEGGQSGDEEADADTTMDASMEGA